MTGTTSDQHHPVRHLVLVTDGPDLLGDEVLVALYEAGCTDASIGHRVVEFDRAAPTRWDAIGSAIRDASRVSGVRVIDVREVESGGRVPA